MNSLITELVQSYQSLNSYWEGSVFQPVTQLSTDYKGRWGEELLYRLVHEHTPYDVHWDGDTNTNCDDGVYDLWWTVGDTKTRVEVKTSGRTVSNGRPVGYQHENVYHGDNSWDKLVFVDYDRDDVIHFTVLSYDSVVVDGRLDLTSLGKRGHVRKNTTDKSKVDFSTKTLRLGLETGVTFRYDVNNPDDEGLSQFLTSRLM